MRYTTTILAAASILSLASANPLTRRWEECKAGSVWHVCWDGWEGCCSVTPCKGPEQADKSFCPDNEVDPDSTQPTACPSSEATPAAPAAPTATVDPDWIKKSTCKEDDSNCNWKPTYFLIKSGNETWTTHNTTGQFYVQKDEGTQGNRRDSIALFTNIPKTAKNCSIAWYKPEKQIFYGTYGDGSMNISSFDLGGKSFAEAVGSEVSYKAAKSFISSETKQGTLDLNNWGRSGSVKLSSGGNFECSSPEMAFHFAMTAEAESSVVADQTFETMGFVERSGWFLKYE